MDHPVLEVILILLCVTQSLAKFNFWKPFGNQEAVDLRDLLTRGIPVFQDNFDGNVLDLQKWQYEVGCDGFNDGMLNCYVAGSNNVQIFNGTLKITAKVENYQGHNFTSGRIRQKGQGHRTGVFVARMKLPNGRQLFPEFLMLEANTLKGCRYQEIDILEYKGENVSTVYSGAFYGRNASDFTLVHKSANKTLGYTSPMTLDLSASFHEYSLVWTNEYLTFYVDTTKILSLPLTPSFWEQEGMDKIPCMPTLPFDDPFQVILNLAVGGSFFGSDPPITPEEAQNWIQPELVVDWVRIYQPLWQLGSSLGGQS